jgi:hypothetical protein
VWRRPESDLERWRLGAGRRRQAEQPDQRDKARRNDAAIPAAAAARQSHCNLPGNPLAALWLRAPNAALAATVPRQGRVNPHAAPDEPMAAVIRPRSDYRRLAA